MTKKEKWLFSGILLSAILIRIIKLGSLPNGINQDEAMAAVDAWALSQYGTDRYGTFLPVHFEAWKYSQMSVLLSYFMVPFIKLMGFNIYAIRLPMLLASCISIVLMYLIGKKLFDTRFGLGVMLMTAINPWHFMQSRWSLDCNLFPHIFLLALYLLLCGLEKRRYLYASMFFFGLTFYCYGIAVYSVTPFLMVFAIWCLWKKQFNIREIIICMGIFMLTALPEILVMAINLFGWSTIETPFFTMSHFPETLRGGDILFLNFSFSQLGKNIFSMLTKVFLQQPDLIFNALPQFGPLFHISIPFIIIGIITFTRDLFVEKDLSHQTKMLAIWGMLITGIWVGCITYEVNINRINIIFFPLIFLCVYGIRFILQKWGKLYLPITGAYGLCTVLFLTAYFTQFAEEIQTYFNVDFLEAVAEADKLEGPQKLYISGNMGWQFNIDMAEILTQYECKIDALYFQGKTNQNHGRELLPYSERYQYIDIKYLSAPDPEGLYVFHRSEIQKIPFSYDIEKATDDYVLVSANDGKKE